MLNILRVGGYAFLGLVNRYRKLPKNTIIVMHGSWIGEESESFLHAHAVISLYKQNKNRIVYIIPSGYDASENSLTTEGEYMADILIKNGIPSSIIMVESKALTTTENIVRSVSLLKQKGVDICSFNVVAIHRPSYIWKTYYLWNLLGYTIHMAIASPEPFKNFIKNAQIQLGNIDKFLDDPIKNELETAEFRSKKRTHLNIQPLNKKELSGMPAQ